MFLCDKCHDPKNHMPFFNSIGPCEGCGKTAVCIDCHDHNCTPPKSKRKAKS